MTQQAPEQQGVHWPDAEGVVCGSCGGPVSVEAHQVVPMLVGGLGSKRKEKMRELWQGDYPEEFCAGCFLKILGTLNNMSRTVESIAHSQPSGEDDAAA